MSLPSNACACGSINNYSRYIVRPRGPYPIRGSCGLNRTQLQQNHDPAAGFFLNVTVYVRHVSWAMLRCTNVDVMSQHSLACITRVQQLCLSVWITPYASNGQPLRAILLQLPWKASALSNQVKFDAWHEAAIHLNGEIPC